MNEFEGLKAALRMSGFPLEVSVEQVLREVGCTEIDADFPYARLAAQQPREVDYVALAPGDRRCNENSDCKLLETRFRHRVLCECKRRHAGVIWLFAPFGGTEAEYKWYGTKLPKRGRLQIAALGAPEGVFFKAEERPTAMSAPVCLRGIELRPYEAKGGKHESGRGHQYKFDENAAAIRDAAYQAAMAVLPAFESLILEAVSVVVGFRTPAPSEKYRGQGLGISVSAYVVTTAKLYCLKPQVGLPEVEAAQSFNQIADPADRVEFHLPHVPEYREQLESIRSRILSEADRASGERRHQILAGLGILSDQLAETRPAVTFVGLDALKTVMQTDNDSRQREALELCGAGANPWGYTYWI